MSKLNCPVLLSLVTTLALGGCGPAAQFEGGSSVSPGRRQPLIPSGGHELELERGAAISGGRWPRRHVLAPQLAQVVLGQNEVAD